MQAVSVVATASDWCGGLLEHGSKPEEVARARLLDDDFLVVLVEGGDANRTRHHNVSAVSVTADAVDALTGSKLLVFDLSGEHAELVIIKIREQWYTAKYFGRTPHGDSPLIQVPAV